MKHRPLTRFLTLTAACVASLGFGAYLSYQAAEHEGAGLDPSAPASIASRPEAAAYAQPSIRLGRLSGLRARLAAQEPSVQEPSVQEASVQEPRETATAEASAPSQTQQGLQARSDGPAPQLALQEAFLRIELSQAQPADFPKAAEKPAASAPLQYASLEMPTLPPADFGRDRSAPLPPRRPNSLSAVTTPAAPVSAAQSSASAAQPAAASAQPSDSGAFPAIADALAAMSASVGPAALPGVAPESAPVGPVASGKFKMGAAVYVRIFKQEGALELWMKRGDRFALFQSFPICKWSGRLGPKTKYADYQSPEGFYSVSSKQLNPHSAYHLAFDVGYPNAYDRRHGATGNAVMVHGDCKSVGCFAMTNKGIDGIYKYVAAALANGQKEVPVHIFPFRMTEQAIARESGGGNVLAFLGESWTGQDWSPFWHNLKQGYDLFEQTGQPPVAYACGDRYEFGANGQSCSRIAGW